MKKLLFLLLLLPLAFSVQAKEYTPKELKRMINAGNYPAQGASKSESKKMEFASCLITTQAIMNEVKSNYPVSVIVDTNIMYSVKAWLNDAAMLVTCSKPDNKMVMTQSPYK